MQPEIDSTKIIVDFKGADSNLQLIKMKSRSPLILLILAYLLCNEALASNPWQTNQKSQHSDPFALVRKAGKHLLTFPKPGSLSAVSGEMVLENQGNYSQTPSPFYSQTNLTQNNTENSLTPEKHIQIPGSQTVGSIRQISGSQAPRSYHPRQINQKSQYSDTSALGKLKSSLISFPQSGHLSTIKG